MIHKFPVSISRIHVAMMVYLPIEPRSRMVTGINIMAPTRMISITC